MLAAHYNQISLSRLSPLRRRQIEPVSDLSQGRPDKSADICPFIYRFSCHNDFISGDGRRTIVDDDVFFIDQYKHVIDVGTYCVISQQITPHLEWHDFRRIISLFFIIFRI